MEHLRDVADHDLDTRTFFRFFQCVCVRAGGGGGGGVGGVVGGGGRLFS